MTLCQQYRKYAKYFYNVIDITYLSEITCGLITNSHNYILKSKIDLLCADKDKETITNII